MEKTLIIFKPDSAEKRKIGTIMAKFEKAGFDIVGCKMMQLNEDLLSQHYAHIRELDVYPTLVEFMSSRPVIVAVVMGDSVVKRVRKLIGPTDSTEAAPGTVRGDWGTNKMRNLIHASDSPENAAIEIDRFFKTEEIFA